MSNLTNELKIKLEKFGIEPKKALGQNFLVSSNVINKIIAATTKYEAQEIIEIGPGLGALTDHLFNIVKDKKIKSFILLEWDHLFSKYWQDQGQLQFNDSCQFQVIDGDALVWKDWDNNNFYNSSQTLLVSNLPYQISSSLVIDRCIDRYPLMGMVLMFQKEVAQRITAKAKSEHYGLLSVIAQTFWSIELVVEAGPVDFYPPPKIASRVLAFKSKKSPIEKPKKFLNFIKGGFSHRRKLLKSNLGAVGLKSETAEKAFQELGLNLQSRAEELTILQWHQLYLKVESDL